MDRLHNYFKLDELNVPVSIEDNKYRIAVLDSGISMHPDLREQLVGFYNFTKDGKGILDSYGHGTHIAGIISGKGYMSEERIQGIDPGAELISLRILDEFGNGKIEDMRDAMEWICQNHSEHRIKIINLSIYLNTEADSGLQNEISAMIKQLASDNIIILAAAGNGANARIDGLAAMPEVITVGCFNENCLADSKGCCQNYSGYGFSEGAICKPDLAAPGYEILSCDYNYAKTGSYYCKKNGTSMSTAVVTGAVSLLYHYYPELNHNQISKLLHDSCRDLNADPSIQGRGMLDIQKLLKNAELLIKNV